MLLQHDLPLKLIACIRDFDSDRDTSHKMHQRFRAERQTSIVRKTDVRFGFRQEQMCAPLSSAFLYVWILVGYWKQRTGCKDTIETGNSAEDLTILASELYTFSLEILSLFFHLLTGSHPKQHSTLLSFHPQSSLFRPLFFLLRTFFVSLLQSSS